MRRALIALGAAVLGATASGAVMHWPDLLGRPKPMPTGRISYGADPLQHVDLWLPRGTPPFPVVLMVHGGCWLTDVAQADIMNWIADDLRRDGIAVWNIEYRGVDRPGGGYPGTFLDVSAAADLLVNKGRTYGLDVDRVVAFGHSAGGHLALWLAARSRLPSTSPLADREPLRLNEAISVGGLPDLQHAATPPDDSCGAEPVRKLVGARSSTRPDVYRDTSPAAMLPFPTPQLLVNATADHIAPPAIADAYAKAAAATGITVRRITIADEGHVELISPGSAAWLAEKQAIEQALALKR